MQSVTKKPMDINVDALRRIAHSTHTAETVLLYLAMRLRVRGSTNIDNTRYQLTQANEKILESDFYKLWKQLEEAGAGRVLLRKSGRPDRFEWFYNLRDIAKLAMGVHVIDVPATETTPASKVAVTAITEADKPSAPIITADAAPEPIRTPVTEAKPKAPARKRVRNSPSPSKSVKAGPKINLALSKFELQVLSRLLKKVHV